MGPAGERGEDSQQLDHLMEAAEWLRQICPPDGTQPQSVPRLRAVIVDLGPNAGVPRDGLKSFRERFPGIAILVDGAASDMGRQSLGGFIEAFSCLRRLSPRQRKILELHLNGRHDKEIAALLGCELTTVYEHWRRMARKSRGAGKYDVVADFHRCLARDLPVKKAPE